MQPNYSKEQKNFNANLLKTPKLGKLMTATLFSTHSWVQCKVMLSQMPVATNLLLLVKNRAQDVHHHQLWMVHHSMLWTEEHNLETEDWLQLFALELSTTSL